MQQSTRSIILYCFFILSCCFLPVLSNAQPGGTEFDDPDAPLDGGISLLVAAGVAYGYKKMRNERKNKLNKLP